MKKIKILLLAVCLHANYVHAQNWLLVGNISRLSSVAHIGKVIIGSAIKQFKLIKQ